MKFPVSLLDPQERTDDRAAALVAYFALQAGRRLAIDDRQQFTNVLRDAAAVDAVKTIALGNVVAALAEHGVRALVLKGVAHGTFYSAPYLRSRQDDDLLVSPDQFELAIELLTTLGYERDVEVDGPLVTGQAHFRRTNHSLTHHIDLHHRTVNPLAFATLPDFQTLWSQRRRVDEVGGFAPSLVHDVVVSCAHRVAHHPRSVDVIWSLDLHFLACELQPTEWDRVIETARHTQMAAVVCAELAAVKQRWASPIPDRVFSSLQSVRNEPSAEYLDATSTLAIEWLNLRHQHTLRNRMGVAWQHLFPAARYMRARYGPANPVRLSWLYAKRAVAGGTRWLREHRTTQRA
jgi:putative nucleotidyltransferase-like protein